jgi:hypothetical protein
MSIAQDVEREKKQEMELKKIKEEEEARRKREEEIQQRRKELLENLPTEPENGRDVITIALRFRGISSNNDEAATQRRFNVDDTMNNVFDWVDAMHGLERERICLSTMNGSRSFVYVEDEEKQEGNVSLKEAGLGKLTALRVSEISNDSSVERIDE